MHLETEKNRKREIRSLWISRINAASRDLGVSYSIFMDSLSKKEIILDRKILSQIAVEDSSTFKRIVELVS